MRVLDRLLLGIAGLSLLLMVFIFFSDESHLSARPLTSQRNVREGREMPVTLNNTADHLELKSADVDAALERYFDEIRKNPERGEEDLRLVDELVPEDEPQQLENAVTAEAPAAEPAKPAPPAKKEAAPVKKSERVQVVKHEVRPGESIWRLAKKYNVSITTIVNANKIKEKTVIQPGDSLRIPDRTGVFHKTAKKESLSDLARRYKVSPE
ncbi:MAG TPA: LysM peptidoglycan-binding domain-containing protein, partial [Turneriella sp.]|nr:LysM peptidoglycan-binding domain-containing protein [Turneriella sp.]